MMIGVATANQHSNFELCCYLYVRSIIEETGEEIQSCVNPLSSVRDTTPPDDRSSRDSVQALSSSVNFKQVKQGHCAGFQLPSVEALSPELTV